MKKYTINFLKFIPNFTQILRKRLPSAYEPVICFFESDTPAKPGDYRWIYTILIYLLIQSGWYIFH